MTMSRSGNRLKIAVGIATAGRPKVISETIRLLCCQTRTPDAIVVCPASPDDLDGETLKAVSIPPLIVTGPTGSTTQRNCILGALTDSDIIVFFDDDYFPCADYLSQVERVFLDCPDIVAATGRPIEDGANGPGLSVAQGLSIVEQASQTRPAHETIADTYGTYGCNMAFRMAVIRKHGIRFDENLPLYGWQEDIDFSRQLAPHGRIVQSDFFRGVHLGSKRGRTSGVRFGYSQVANPVYLIGKGTMSWRFAWRIMVRNIAANVLRSFAPEPWIDRRGRLKGNLLALIDMIAGRMSPGRILNLG